MRIVIEFDPVQMDGFNEEQQRFILRVMAQRMWERGSATIAEIAFDYADELADLADDVGSVWVRPE